MFVFDEIQADILDPSVKLSTIMRKAKVLAYNLKNKEFKEWVDQELNGYTGSWKTWPDYRKTFSQSYGNFVGAFGRQLSNAPIPTLNFPEEVQEFASTLPFPQGVRELESTLESLHERGETFLAYQWPADFTALIARYVYQDMVCLQAWKALNKGQIEHVLDTVRNRLLNFVLELREISQETVDKSGKPQPIPVEKVSQVFNTYIMGSHNVVASGASVTQTVEQKIMQRDFTSLKENLKSLGIDEHEINELKEALEADGKRTKEQHFGTRVGSWLGKMTQKIATGVWKIGMEAGPVLLTNAISAYYGWK